MKHERNTSLGGSFLFYKCYNSKLFSLASSIRCEVLIILKMALFIKTKKKGGGTLRQKKTMPTELNLTCISLIRDTFR